VPPIKRTRHRSASYGPTEVELLKLCWLVTDGICGKRLALFLPELLRRLRHWHALHDVPAEVQARVPSMSAATVDRALRPYRTREGRHGISTTKAGALFKRQIAIRTFADWTDVKPGFLEMDLVAHCGWNAAGQFLYPLSMVDVATGWVVCAGLRDKRHETVFSGLQRLQADLPVPILGPGKRQRRRVHQPTADRLLRRAEHHLHAGTTVCQERLMPHRTKELGGVVRRLVGYDRLELPTLRALEHIHDLARHYVNFLHPVRKLVSKTRDGARVRRSYDAAPTPFHRLLDVGVQIFQPGEG